MVRMNALCSVILRVDNWVVIGLLLALSGKTVSSRYLTNQRLGIMHKHGELSLSSILLPQIASLSCPPSVQR